MSDIEGAWDEVHVANTMGWRVGWPYLHDEAGCWEQYAFDPTERPDAGKRSRQWIAIGSTEVDCVREMARCLREFREGRWPRQGGPEATLISQPRRDQRGASMNRDPVRARYGALLASIGDRASEIEPRPLVSHWPHVGSAYRGLLIVGQALRGWGGEWQAGAVRTAEGRERVLDATVGAATEHLEPLAWVPSHRKVRNSPFWTFSRHLVEAIEPGPEPWYARYAWANLYPVAPERPPGNPTGVLKEGQDRFVGPLLLDLVEMLDARRVVVIAGPVYWYHARRTGDLWGLSPTEKPLTWRGRAYGREWVIGYHPQWASFQGWGAPRYAQLVSRAFEPS